MCECTHVPAFMCFFLCVCVHMWSTSHIIPQESSTLFLETRSHVGLELAKSESLVDRDPWDPPQWLEL